jgi:AAA+ superfamily predicted ATPase
VSWEERNRLGLVAAVDRLLERLDGRRDAPAPAGADAPALDALCRAFALSPFERDVLMLCAGVELDRRVAEACARAHGAPCATFGLALAVLDEPHWSALAPTGALRHWRLVEVGHSAGVTAAPLRIDERVLHFVAGVGHLDAGLEGIVQEAPAAGPLAPSHEEAVGRLAAALAAAASVQVELVGAAHDAKRDVVAAACERAGRRLFDADAAALPRDSRESARLARLWEREAALTAGVLMVDADCADGGEPRAALLALARRLRGPLVVLSAEPLSDLRAALRIEVATASARERRALWRAALGPRAEQLNGTLDALASQFDLDVSGFDAAAAEVAGAGGDDVSSALWDACRARVRPRLDDLAQRVVSAATWDDLVVVPEARRTLEMIAAQVRRRDVVYEDWGFALRGSRGLGISALFAGSSGTGKTMAAEVLANDLGLDLYRIDLSAVVSKYIGETEKNLRRVFDAADRGGAVLLFDEADALFGRRTEVKDSHDRFANIEVSYLLQRMETYRGLAILTTNRRDAIDEAFMRRLRFVVDFPFPDAAQRTEIWRRVFPSAVPRQDLDLDALAALAVAGGNIRNIALGAAFLAADGEGPVGMAHVLRAARAEYAKLERPLSSPELGGVT